MKPTEFYTPYPDDPIRTLAWEIDEWLSGASIIEDMGVFLTQVRDVLLQAAER
jgi:hypothetical protein